jgi:hypothetical protein
MALEKDVWRTAGLLVDRHGDDAPLYALQSVDQLVERGDFKGAEQWRRVWRAALDLLRTVPLSPHQVN